MTWKQYLKNLKTTKDKDFHIDDISDEIKDNDTEIVQSTGVQLDAEAVITCVEPKGTTNVNESSTEENTIMIKHSRVTC